jgi:type I restriction enzyme M protein
MKRGTLTNKENLANDIWRVCDIMRRDNNCGGVMDYVEHLSWVLFLKFLDEQEKTFEQEAEIAGRPYEYIVEKKYRWSEWVPKVIGEVAQVTGRRGTPEWNASEVMGFITGELLPYLAELGGTPQRDVIGTIFGGDRNIIVCASAYNLRNVLEIVDGIDFLNTDDIHTISHVYEGLLQKMGNENNMAGEFYTPRPVARFMVDVIDPQIGESIYDPACGSCGFLVEAFQHMKQYERETRDHQRLLLGGTFFGNEKKAVPTLLGTMNLALHGVALPQIHRCNTLEENIRVVTELERFDVILSNPPFGGRVNEQILLNFPVKSNATELLFLEHIMRKLKHRNGARCGVVVPESTLFHNGAFTTVKEELLTSFSLFLVVSLPPGTFAPYSGVKTALLFFERPGPTTEVLYLDLQPPENLKKFNKSKPITDKHFANLFNIWKQWKCYRQGKGPSPEATEISWIETIESLAARGYDLSARKPGQSKAEELPSPSELIERLLERHLEFQRTLERLHATVTEKKEEL